MNEEEIFTPAHRAAKEEVLKILDKWFDGYVLTVMVTSQDGQSTSTESAYSGSLDTAVGMAARLQHRLINGEFTT